MRALWPGLLLLVVATSVVGCRLLAADVPCVNDSNCRLDSACDELAGVCVPRAVGPADGGARVDGGPGPGEDGGPGDDDAGPGDDDAGPGDEDAGLPGCMPDNAGAPPAVDTDPCAGGACTVRRVGHSATGCPGADSGACDFYPDQDANPIQAAIDAAVAGDVVWLYGDPTLAFAGQVRVTKSLTLEGAPGEPLSSVRITNSQRHEPGTIQLDADDVTLRRFLVYGQRQVVVGITAVKGPSGTAPNDYTNGFSSGHLIEQLVLRSVEPAVAGNNSTSEALVLGGGALVRNNYIEGWWEGGVLQGSAVGGFSDLRVVHNTFVIREPDAAVSLTDISTGVVVRNNLMATLNPGSEAAVIRRGNNDVTAAVEGNVVFGYPAIAGVGVTEGANNRVADPAFPDWRQPHVAAGGEPLCGGVDDAERGEADLYGDARGDTVGAVQPARQSAPAPLLVHIGSAVDGCDSTCDFSGPLALRDALYASPPGVRVVMHGDGAPTRFRLDQFTVDRRTEVTVPDGQPVDAVVLYREVSSAPQRWGTLTVTLAEGVELEGFTVEVGQGGRYGVLVDAYESNELGDPAARDAVLRRIRVVALAGGNDAAFSTSFNTELSNCSATGSNFTAFVDIAGPGARVVNNTFVSLENNQTPVAAFTRGSADVVLANNVFDLRGATSLEAAVPFRSSPSGRGDYDLPANFTVESNQLYGVGAVDADEAPLPLPSSGGTNCVVGTVVGNVTDACAADAPGFVNLGAGDLRPTAGSPLVDAGDDTYATGTTDLGGRARTNGVVDVGAFERTDADP